MKYFLAIILVAAMAAPAVAQSCRNGKCISPAKREILQRKAMKQRLATPVRVTPAIQRINQQIMVLARTNVNGRNTARIGALQRQRNQILNAQRRR